MSTISTLFLTKDNEHFYQELGYPIYKDGKIVGYPLVLEMDKENIKIVSNDDESLVIEITNPDSELYKHLMKMKE